MLATTDFESVHTEILTIESVNAAKDEITVTEAVQYRHVGEMSISLVNHGFAKNKPKYTA